MKVSNMSIFTWLVALECVGQCHGLAEQTCSRRSTLGWLGGACAGLVAGAPAWGASAVQDSMNVDQFLRSGMDAGGNMGVSSQAGKSRPETGVYLR
jgi:hypothetical protein